MDSTSMNLESEQISTSVDLLKIRSFKAIERVALRKLDMIQAAIKVDTLRIPPANHLEQLSGDREGQYSIRINDQWRICFLWEGTDAFDVEIVDYH
nr:type II toxin-antitoxin system RelE/ParE family toxin [uncultured Treponema sp.]